MIHWRTSVLLLAVFCVGLLAGLMIGTGMDQYTHRHLAASAWVDEHQVMDALFRRVLPTWWNTTVFLLVISAFLTVGRTRWMFAAAALLLAVSLVTTVRIEVPMNRQIAQWNVALPPQDWAAVRDRWLRFHLLRTSFGTVSFLISLLAWRRTGATLAER